MSGPHLFVSHSHHDNAYCRRLVQTLQANGLDVWYDESSIASGPITAHVEQGLRKADMMVLVLSPAALKSKWVRDEATWYYELCRHSERRTLLPVLAESIRSSQLWLFLRDLKRIEDAKGGPLAPDLAAVEICRILQISARRLNDEVEQRANEIPTNGLSTRLIGTEEASTNCDRGPQTSGRRQKPPVGQDRKQHVPLTYSGLVKYGLELVGSGHMDAGRAYLEAALKLPANQTSERIQQTFILAAVGRYEEALASAESALRLEPDSGPLWCLKGLSLRNLSRFSEALESFRHGVELLPSSPVAWECLGACLRATHANVEALEAYERAISLDGSNPGLWEHKAQLLLGLSRYHDALLAAEHALALESARVFAWLFKSAALFQLGRFTEVVPASEGAIRLDPNNAIAWILKATSLAQLERYSEVLGPVERAIELNPHDASLWLTKGVALTETGQHTLALAAFDRAAEFEPESRLPWQAKLMATQRLEREANVQIRRLEALEDRGWPGLLTLMRRFLGV